MFILNVLQDKQTLTFARMTLFIMNDTRDSHNEVIGGNTPYRFHTYCLWYECSTS